MKRVGFSAWLIAFALLGFGPSAFGQANINLTSPGNNVMNGIYVGPYTATVNGVSTQIICDDFADETYSNESWTANINNISSPGTKWGTPTSLYNEAAYFATVMMQLESTPQNAATMQIEGYLSYTIWALFDPSGVEAWLGNGSTAWTTVEGILGLAGNYANVAAPTNMVLYTPIAGTAVNCDGGACSGPPQEFIAFVPEGGSPLLYLVFAGLACGAAMFYRSRPLGMKASA